MCESYREWIWALVWVRPPGRPDSRRCFNVTAPLATCERWASYIRALLSYVYKRVCVLSLIRAWVALPQGHAWKKNKRSAHMYKEIRMFRLHTWRFVVGVGTFTQPWAPASWPLLSQGSWSLHLEAFSEEPSNSSTKMVSHAPVTPTGVEGEATVVGPVSGGVTGVGAATTLVTCSAVVHAIEGASVLRVDRSWVWAPRATAAGLTALSAVRSSCCVDKSAALHAIVGFGVVGVGVVGFGVVGCGVVGAGVVAVPPTSTSIAAIEGLSAFFTNPMFSWASLTDTTTSRTNARFFPGARANKSKLLITTAPSAVTSKTREPASFQYTSAKCSRTV